MAYEQNIREPVHPFEYEGDGSPKNKWRSVSSATNASENANACFDCNICLDSAHDPVVTLCGHLYCWPCIYMWLHVQNSSSESEEQPKCPICKANISESSLVPLYGRGSYPSEPEHTKRAQNPVIPPRPTANGVQTVVTSPPSVPPHLNQTFQPYPFQAQHQPFHHQHYFPHPHANYAPMASSNFGNGAMASIFSPTVGMFGDFVYTRIFGSSDAGLVHYPYPNAYALAGHATPRMRRQEIELDKSLNRVSIFLFCCFILCLLLF